MLSRDPMWFLIRALRRALLRAWQALPNECQYGQCSGGPNEPDPLRCGEPAAPGSSWCAKHIKHENDKRVARAERRPN